MKPDRSGPAAAIPSPAKIAVMSRYDGDPVNHLSTVPMPMTAIDQAMTRSSPARRPSLTAKAGKIPMHSTGMDVSRLADKALMPKSRWMAWSMGATEFIAGRKFKEAKIKAAAIMNSEGFFIISSPCRSI